MTPNLKRTAWALTILACAVVLGLLLSSTVPSTPLYAQSPPGTPYRPTVDPVDMTAAAIMQATARPTRRGSVALPTQSPAPTLTPTPRAPTQSVSKFGKVAHPKRRR